MGKDLIVNRGVWGAETAGATPATRTILCAPIDKLAKSSGLGPVLNRSKVQFLLGVPFAGIVQRKNRRFPTSR